ncbi:tail-specific protease [Chlorobaculum limnaeum]|uniref:Tail-specific protease n=2 Tax=Chlorobaculum limnaeum TaxID=274537 RepID=A0A1D8D4U1_CHLLM|nr:carboxy terminal-processing peptidase [Chlorobaculum limnaeum]AOS85025.1 tail-specific protease [Chlorobaculum limnaeum]
MAAAGKGAQPALLKPTPNQEEAARYIAQYLLQNHYRKVPVNDSLAQQIFNRYLDNLDNNRSYFTAPEVEKLRQEVGVHLDDDFVSGNPARGFAIYNLFLKRAREKMVYMKSSLQTAQFDFSAPETLELERSKTAPWPADQAGLHELWRKELKYQYLSMKYSGEKGKNIRTELLKSFDNRIKIFNQQKPEDAFQAYMLAVTSSFDPHTDYFSPDEFENFQIDMSRSLEGIGAKLQMENEYTVVNEIIPGGPAFKSNRLKKGDKIVGVGQGDKGEIIDVIGWRINDVVKKIRGPKGTVVRLKVLPASQAGKGPARIIRLVRATVDLQEQAAQKKIIYKNGRKIGVIVLPSFYLDFEGERQQKQNYTSTTKDVTRIINELKRENVEGIIVDLRENGGGSLEEAVNVTGLFTGKGPVVQVSNALGGKMVLRDENYPMLYSGPLVVLVNRYSASASEIFAAAIQDYGRGLVVGDRTFGKGTVQSIVTIQRPFSMFMKQSDLGQLKLTIAKFYRISGGSTQHIGVLPDIVLPSLIDPEVVGEDTYTSSLPWTTVSRTPYLPSGTVSREEIASLKKQFASQSARNKLYQSYLADLATLNRIRQRKSVSLQEKSFEAENKALKEIQDRWGDANIETGKKKKTDFILQQAAGVLNDLVALKARPAIPAAVPAARPAVRQVVPVR